MSVSDMSLPLRGRVAFYAFSLFLKESSKKLVKPGNKGPESRTKHGSEEGQIGG